MSAKMETRLFCAMLIAPGSCLGAMAVITAPAWCATRWPAMFAGGRAGGPCAVRVPLSVQHRQGDSTPDTSHPR